VLDHRPGGRLGVAGLDRVDDRGVLRDHARDPALLLALGKLCMKRELWGKAQSYIEASLALEPTHDGHMTLAALMERLGKPQEAVHHFRRSAELAG